MMNERTIARTDAHFETVAGGVSGRVVLKLFTNDGARLRAEVSFEGSELPAVTAEGDEALPTLLEALRLGTNTLKAFREAGGRVLQDVHAFGRHPLTESLEAIFGMSLTPFGHEEPLDAEIVRGPTPTATGDVVFTVVALGQTVEVATCPIGAGGATNQDPDALHHATRAVRAYFKERRDEEWSLYRAAARLRRAAGNPPWFPRRPASHVQVGGTHEGRESFVEIPIIGLALPFVVCIFKSGGVLDDCNDWSAVTDDERQAATTAALDYFFDHVDEMASLGFDVEVLREFHR